MFLLFSPCFCLLSAKSSQEWADGIVAVLFREFGRVSAALLFGFWFGICFFLCVFWCLLVLLLIFLCFCLFCSGNVFCFFFCGSQHV